MDAWLTWRYRNLYIGDTWHRASDTTSESNNCWTQWRNDVSFSQSNQGHSASTLRER